jgi:hypothetical protein
MRQSNSLRIMLAAFVATTLYGQENSIRMDGGPSWKGLSIRFSPRVEPDGSGASNALGGTVIDLLGGVVGQRFIDDPAHKRSFGYDVRVEPSPNGNSAQIRIEPLHSAQHAVQSGWTQFGLPAGLPKYPVIPDLKAGDTVVIDLLMNPATGQKIVDYLTLVRTGGPDGVVVHDFTLTDVQLSLNRPRVMVDGKALESAESSGTTGAFVWIYLKGHGRFILSLFPNQKFGFQKNGAAEADALTFHDGPTEIRVNCEGAVAPGQGPYNLYVVHEPAWHAYSPSDSIEIGSADDAGWIVGKH